MSDPDNLQTSQSDADRHARLTAWVSCSDCNGSGNEQVRSMGEFVNTGNPCPSCSGLGELPSDGLVEAVAKELWDDDFKSGTVDDLARAALVAARLYELRGK